jgi:response regulator RpfG family c-di-GMP phosphodiesterase
MLTVSVPDRILVVDQEASTREAVETHLVHRGYEVLTVAAGEEALGVLTRQKISCMMADARLFGTPSGELLSRSLERDPNLAILVTGSPANIEDVVQYLQYGAVDYLRKPLDLTRLEAALQKALRRRGELIRERGIGRLLKDEVVNLGAELARERAKVKNLTLATLETLVAVVEARDAWFAGHSLRVAQLAASIAAETGRTDEEVEQVRHAGLLHDIGMIAVPEGLLSIRWWALRSLRRYPISAGSVPSFVAITSAGMERDTPTGSLPRQFPGGPGSLEPPRCTMRSARPGPTGSSSHRSWPSNACAVS